TRPGRSDAPVRTCGAGPARPRGRRRDHRRLSRSPYAESRTSSQASVLPFKPAHAHIVSAAWNDLMGASSPFRPNGTDTSDIAAYRYRGGDMPGIPLRQRSAWQALERHHAQIAGRHLRELFSADPGRGERLTAQAEDIYLDY